ncbi:MAG: ABC transporter substrate-binding protein [Rhodospirillales bacterium]|nr:ABC transporter substrate-binding protein [Rhodospirillales bacterium]MDE2458020.1 ABC transporter substrate-binding protein [Rhodospirillales bacterium]
MKNIFRCPALALAGGLFFMPSAMAAGSDATGPVSALDNALISAMKSALAGQKFQARYDALAPVIEQTYDLPEVTKNSVGFLWSTLPASQQSELIDLFTQFTVSSYVSQFNSYNGQTLSVVPPVQSLGQKKIVETKLSSNDGSVKLDYVVARNNDSWKIDDVLLNGTISQVAVHASDFASLVKSGDASQLIAALKAKITDLRDSSAG